MDEVGLVRCDFNDFNVMPMAADAKGLAPIQELVIVQNRMELIFHMLADTGAGITYGK